MGTPTEHAAITVGGRAVLNEAVQIAAADLESGDEFAPIVVTKDWGDCQVERFGVDELEEARSRLDDLLGGSTGSGDCALAHDERLAGGSISILIQVGRMGGEETQAFVQRYRPKRGMFRPFKLVGTPVPASEARAGDATVPQPSVSEAAGNGANET
jgi:hypothetical protein